VCAPSPRHERVYARLRRAKAKRSREGWGEGTFAARPPHPILHVATIELPSSRKRGEGVITTIACAVISHHFSNSRSRSRARFLRPGFALPLHSPRFMGWAERRESSGACEAPVGPALSGQARHLARRLASPYGGRSPPGAPPWRFLAPVPRFPHRHSRRIGHSELLAPGRSARWRPPGPPGAAVMSRYRRTPLLAPHSGSSREHAPNERGCESLWWPLFAVKCKKC
jgi:hypothetical protein